MTPARCGPLRRSPLLPLGCALVACGAEEGAPNLTHHAEEVSFPGLDLALEGTLLVPEHLPGQQLPAVILGHGSGPIDRDETIAGQLGMAFGFEIRVFGELAGALADAGYVVLRYDKRSCTARTPIRLADAVERVAHAGVDDLGRHVDPAVPAELVRFLRLHGGAP